MQNKLQELTEKLYNEGLSKGRQEAEMILAKASSEAADIVAKAREESGKIIEDARKEAEEIRDRLLNELRMASRQSITTLKKEIETLIIFKALGTPVKDTLEDTELIKSVIKSAVEAFKPETGSSASLNIILPERLKGQLDNFIRKEIEEQMKVGIILSFDKKMSGGFKIGPKDDNYFISFTDKDFQEFLGGYLRPKTREILFSE
jgi:V/A-type H+-transporting ATPase subunit E